jgi:hypothetical protein
VTRRVNELKKRINNNPITILIVLVVFFISSFFTILQGISWLINYYNTNIDWRQTEYNKINQVRSGMNYQKFVQVFGVPEFTRTSKDGLIENTFKRRDYWIQTISNNTQQVLAYAVTSCDDNFKPKIAPNPLFRDIILNDSTFSDIGNDPIGTKYFIGNTANTYFYDIYSLGNPSDYQTVYVGIDDACGFGYTKDMEFSNINPDETVNLNDPSVIKFRNTSKINTYAELAVFADENIFKSFQIGVDRILIRPSDIDDFELNISLRGCLNNLENKGIDPATAIEQCDSESK